MTDTATSITYQVSESDYIAAQRLYTRHLGGWGRVVRVGIALLGLAFAAFAVYKRIPWLAVMGVLYGAMPWWMFQFVNVPMARRQYRRYPAMHQAQSVGIADDGSGLQAKSAIGEGAMAWPMLVRWVEDEHYLLIFLQPRLYLIVPKRADAENLLIPRLRALLAQHVGPVNQLRRKLP